MKTLVLAEKPSVGKEIAEVLNCKDKQIGFISGKDYIVTWAMGHLVTLADPEHYSNEWKNWDLEVLPMIPKKHELVVINDVKKQFFTVRDLLSKTDELIIATDAGREGELVARWIMKKCNYQKNFKRLWISSLTQKSILEGFKNLKEGKQYNSLYYQAESRSIADWLVGLNVTRALTCKYNASLSAGRVQTPTLNMIMQREEERKKFIPKNYYQLQIRVNGIYFNHINEDKGIIRFFEEDKVRNLEKILSNKRIKVKAINKTMKKKSPPLLYDLTELQREANKRFGFSPKKTLDLIQSLYEVHKYLTYPRTDSRYLTTDLYETIKDRLINLDFNHYKVFSKKLLKVTLTRDKRIFDNSKVSDHHAIIPTEHEVEITNLSRDEFLVYELVVKRFISAFMNDYLYEQTEIILESENKNFMTRGRIIKEEGFKEIDNPIDDEEEDDKESLPDFSAKEYIITDTKVIKLQTEPPKRFTEASLLSAMEHPQNFITDQKYKKILENCAGIGTPATRAEIIERLFQAGYVELSGKEIIPKEKGKQLINLIPDDLKSAELTASWEEQLNLIKEQKLNKDVFIKDITAFAEELVANIKNAKNNFKHDNITNKLCPLCGKSLLEESNNHGKRLVCIDRNCEYRQNLSKLTNARCPKCFKKLTVVGTDVKKYVCACGFKENFDSFNQKLSENKKNMNKREVNEYLHKQEREEKIISPFMQDLLDLKKKL